MKTSNRTFTVEVLNWFCLGLLSLMFLVGCGGGGGGGGGGGEQRLTTIQGAAFVPGGGAAPKPSRYKPLPENGPFVGASVVAWSLTSGAAYPLGSVTLAGVDGVFKIQEVLPGQDYLVTAKKGNMVVMKVIRVPENPPETFDIGEVDAASTSVALMLEHFIKEVLGQIAFDIGQEDNNIDPGQLEEAIQNADFAALERTVVELATKVEELGDDVEALRNELASSNGVEYSDKVAIVNVYNIVVQILNISDANTNGQGRDALDEWRHDGKIGGVDVDIVAAQITAVVDNNGVLVNISVNQVGVVPTDLSDGLKTITKPQTTITSKPENTTTLTSASFSFVSSRPNSTFQCQLDGGEFSNCTSPKEYSALAIGQHTFCVVATDKDGVKDPSEACYPWVIFIVDPTPPETTIIDGPPNPSGSSTATFDFVSNEQGSTFQCELDGGGFSECTSPKTYPGLANGTHTFKVKATDPSGNKDEEGDQRTWNIQIVPPDTIIDNKPFDLSSSTLATFTFHAVPNDAGTTFECDLDGGGFITCTSPKTYTDLANGEHTFMVRGRNVEGVADSSPASWPWTIDATTPPETIVDGGPSGSTSATLATFTFHAELGGVTLKDATFQCKLDAGSFTTCTSPKIYPSLAEGPHDFMVKAINASGVEDASPAQRDWTIDTDLCEFLCEDFENGQGTWSADTGVWQIGTPTVGVGPGGCAGGVQCAGTVLAGNYPPDTDSRLTDIRAIVLPSVTGAEEIHLRFMTWFSYSTGDSGQVQISVRDSATGVFGPWVNEGTAVVNTSGWSLKDVDLTKYAGSTVRIGFFHSAQRIGCCGNTDESTGWYIDDIQVVAKVPAFNGDFEAGWGDWGAEGGVWQVGTPTAGPSTCFAGTQCAGTELNGVYGPDTDSLLITATTVLPTVTGLEEVHLRFQNWFSYSTGDSGQVKISVWDPTASSWGLWESVGTPVVSVSGGWTLKDVDLTEYAGSTVRIGFFHSAQRIGCCGNTDESTGWYIDDVVIQKF